MNLENLRQNTNANLNARLRTWTPNIERGTITQHQRLVRANSSNVSKQLINNRERISNIDPKNHFLQNLSLFYENGLFTPPAAPQFHELCTWITLVGQTRNYPIKMNKSEHAIFLISSHVNWWFSSRIKCAHPLWPVQITTRCCCLGPHSLIMANVNLVQFSNVHEIEIHIHPLVNKTLSNLTS